MSQPGISVVMPVYNAESYVGTAVQSILRQTYADFEFHIVDDGSTDGSLAVLEKYARSDDRIRLRSRPNTGYVVALNEMLSEARAPYIARMDADDISLAHRFERQVEFLDENPDVLCVGSAVQWIDPEGDPLRVHQMPLDHSQIDAAHLAHPEAVICHPTVLMRADAIRRVGGYDQNLVGAEDLDVWLKMAEFGTVRNLDEVLLQYRFHLQKYGSAQKPKQLRSAETAIRDAQTRRGLEETGFTDEYRPQSRADQYANWAWWALADGNVRTARKYASALVVRRPWSVSTWRILRSAVRGY